MHFLTLIAVQVSDIVEDQKQNQIIEEEKNKLKKAIQEKGRESVIESVFLQRLNHLSTPFSRTVDAAVAEKLEPFSTNTDDPSYLEFVDQTEELKQEYEQGTDCVKLPQGKIVPLGYESYYGRYLIRDGKVFERRAGPVRQPRRTKRAKRMKRCQIIRSESCIRIFASSWKNGRLLIGMRNSRPTVFTATPTPNGTGIPLAVAGLVSCW